MNQFDLLVVVLDIMFQIFWSVLDKFSDPPQIGVFRIFRLVRVLRAFRVLTTFRELYVMLHSFIGAMKAIFWALLMIFVVLTIWSIIAVEVLHPLNKELARSG